MPLFQYFSRSMVLLFCSSFLLVSACSDDKKEAQSVGDGSVTWTYNTSRYASTNFLSAIIKSTARLLITASSADLKNAVLLGLDSIGTKGMATVALRNGLPNTTRPHRKSVARSASRPEPCPTTASPASRA
ncbi:hypothetical protein [Hymenobacter volaticus]|uniref:Uncharacterized protein n=1 Tax=Hymenobacter volaticus TaxID=2932254 RepID=A0ABY4G7V4_9BACT|nr:hypothetical protein [Hymenobacter volaticus]UOQ66990.1 hypothetical protein MUN86_03500 [Hymenobacter volaticus]